MKYREEIDGLRAVAVLPVILFHAGFDTFSGGYVGVDVFFVISGYLITTIILSEKEQGRFSLVNFYERRARRIIPALFLVMTVSTVLSWFWLHPPHMKDFSQSLVAVSLFSSNILFWQESGYWGVENELKPLLHTWSLAVEEQYYVLFPLFLMLMWSFRKRWILGSFMLIAAASLLYSQWASVHSPVANFFLLTSRAWELAIGAGIAFYFLYRKGIVRSLLARQAVDELMGWVGLGLIAFAVFAFDENTPFPGVYALVPTVGTALVIVFASSSTMVGSLLGSGFPVQVGLISYSAYLWHQPLFVFARHRSLLEPTPALLLGLSAASLLLAYLSWRYVEAPFRKRGVYTRQQVFALTAAGSLLFIAIGVAGNFTDGYRYRVDDRLVDSMNQARDTSFVGRLCERDGMAAVPDDFCVLVAGGERQLVLFGDSHAETLAREAKRAFADSGYTLLMATENACPPLLGVYRVDHPNRQACVDHNERIYRYIEQTPQVETVILMARWALGMEGRRFDNSEGGIEHGRKPHLDIIEDGEYLFHEAYDHRDRLARAYANSVDKLAATGKQLILVYPVPEAGWNVPDYIGRYYWGDPTSVFDAGTASTSHEVYRQRNRRSIDALDSVVAPANIARVRPQQLFCSTTVTGRCVVQEDGVMFYRDDDHLSDAGARLLLQRIIGIIAERDESSDTPKPADPRRNP